jgi:hypothetical protein
VQAVLLGLHDAKINHSVTQLPPFETFIKSGVMMPAANIDGGGWRLESVDILHDIGFAPVVDEQKKLVMSAWRGLAHRVDSAALFWGNFALAGDTNPSLVIRLVNNFFRSFVVLNFFLLIRFFSFMGRSPDPVNFGDQFLPFENMLETSNAPYLSGQQPNSLDFLLFGMIQSHCSTYVPPIAALQNDPRLARMRAWIGAMQERFRDYDYLYSSVYFAPFAAPPKSVPRVERIPFWLGAVFMVVYFPITVPLIALLSIRNRMKPRTNA